MAPKKGFPQFLLVCLAGVLLMAFAYLSEVRQRGKTVTHREKTTAAAKTSEKGKATAAASAEKTTVESAGRTGAVIERGERAARKTVTRTRTIVERDVTTGAIVREVTEREDETEGEETKLTTETTTITSKTAEFARLRMNVVFDEPIR